MENQKKNQTFPKKQNPANFFKDNITEKMKNYFPEEGNSGITEKLKSLADKVLMKEKISSEYNIEKEGIHKFEYFNKEFGFLRDLIDNQVSDEAIISSLKLFKNNGIVSNNDLTENLFNESCYLTILNTLN